MIELLTQHTYIENEVMYPRVRELLPELEDDVLESYEEHHVADVLIMGPADMSPSDGPFDAKTTVLIENVENHIDEEEDEWFPKVRGGPGRNQLQEIGEEMLAAKKNAPTRPSQPSALKKTTDAVISQRLRVSTSGGSTPTTGHLLRGAGGPLGCSACQRRTGFFLTISCDSHMRPRPQVRPA